MLLYALAGHLGKTVSELIDLCPADEYLDWMRLQGIEPWGQRRDDINAALIRESVLAPWSKKPIPASDLIPQWGGKPELTEEQRAARWEQSVAAFVMMAKAMKAPSS